MDDDLVKEVVSILRKKYGSLRNVAKILNFEYENFKSFIRKKNIGRPDLTLFKRMLSLADFEYEQFLFFLQL